MGVVHPLPGETNAEFVRARTRKDERAVVETPAAAEASAAFVEGETGTEEDLDRPRIDHRREVMWLADAEGAGQQFGDRIADLVKREVLALDLRKHPAASGFHREKREQVDLAGQGGEAGDRSRFRMRGEPACDRIDHRRGVLRRGVGEIAHGGAEEGFELSLFGNCHLPRRGLLPSFRLVKRSWQAVTTIWLTMLLNVSAAPAPKIEWKPIENPGGRVSRDLGMLDSERDEYATHLASQAANLVVDQKASKEALESARHMLALAFQLSPRNKRAVVVNFQLGKGLLPEKVDGVLGSQAFARLLLTRADLLEKQGGSENTSFARLFVALAAEIDPRNEDAVYASELHRLDHGPVDWNVLAGDKEKKAKEGGQ